MFRSHQVFVGELLAEGFVSPRLWLLAVEWLRCDGPDGVSGLEADLWIDT